MPSRLLYDFQSMRGNHWYVQFDENAQTIFAEADPFNGEIEPQVNENELNGRKIGQVLHQFCEGTTNVQIVVTNLHPFAKFNRVPNSRGCGYSPGDGGCTFTQFDIIKTDESKAGNKDGTIKLNAELPGHLLHYSLDGINWQADNVFKNLIPGVYFVHAKSTTSDCIKKEKTFILAGAVQPFIPYPWQEKVCKIFRLVQNGVPYIISEPVKWDQVEIKGNRDKDFHGWKSQYSDGSIELEFSCDQGKGIIIGEHELNGNDGYTEFQYGFVSSTGDFVILFDGKLNYNTYKKKRSTVSVMIESKDYNDAFHSRMDAKVSLSEGKTQDGNFIAVPRVYNVGLHGKAIATSFRVNNQDTIDYPVFNFREARSYIIPDTTKTITNEISDTYPYGIMINNEAPYDIELHNIDIQFKGDYSFNVNFGVWVKMKGRRQTAGSYKLTPYFMIDDKKYPAGVVKSGNLVNEWVSVPVDFHYAGDHTLAAGAKVYWFIQMETVGFVEGPALQQWYVDISVSALEEAQGSSTNGWLLHDVINYVARNITDNRTYLNSNFLSLKSSTRAFDGEGSLYVLTNGKQIRKYNVQDHPLKISLKECLQIVKNIFCVGYGFEKFGGNEFLRIERVNYFYQNRKILQIDDPFSYEEEVARDLLYNEIEYGYERFQEEGINTLDEYNTRHEVLLPIKTHKAKLVVKSPAIASGYSIEKCRRNQYEDTPSDSVENDDDPFIISVNKDAVVGFKAEKNEAFDIVNNVISPATAYNLRITPKRIEVNWSIWVSNILHYKQPVEELRTNFVVQNAKLQTKLKINDLRPVGDIFKDVWQEDETIQLAKYPVQERIFRPEYIRIKAKITPDKFVMLDLAMRGMYSSTINYGYVAVKDNEGLYQAGYLMEISYNFHTELVTMKLLKKHDSPVNPDEECCNYITINGCRILINGKKVIF